MRPGTCGLEAIKHMVPAQKQPPTTEPEPEISSPPPSKGFGKVLSSIQGLQQRLDDFSLEEASQAEQKAQSLIDKLKALQARLQLFAKLRELAADTNHAIGEIPEANFDLVAPDSLENHPQLRAIVQAGKLIRMHRLLQAARAGIESVGLNFEAPSQTPPSSANDHRGFGASGTALAPQPSTASEMPQAILAMPPSPDINDTHTGAVPLAGDPTKTPGRPAAVSNTVARQADKTAAKYDFAELKLEDFESPAPRREPLAGAATKPVGTRAAGAKKDKTAPNKSHFDERLLSDLIDTYGEFILSSAPSKPIEPTPELARTVAVRKDSIEQRPAVPSVALVPVKHADPAALPALPPPQDQDEEEKAADVDAFVPSIKNRGEIDRQLKSIIKDYGEYDLYSHSKPSKFNKTAAIAAFVVLGLVLGGFYLFKSPPARTPATAENTAPAQATSKSPSNPTPDDIKPQNP